MRFVAQYRKKNCTVEHEFELYLDDGDYDYAHACDMAEDFAKGLSNWRMVCVSPVEDDAG